MNCTRAIRNLIKSGGIIFSFFFGREEFVFYSKKILMEASAVLFFCSRNANSILILDRFFFSIQSSFCFRANEKKKKFFTLSIQSDFFYSRLVNKNTLALTEKKYFIKLIKLLFLAEYTKKSLF